MTDGKKSWVEHPVFWFFVPLIPLIYPLYPIISGNINPNPVEDLLLKTGETALYMLVFMLWISPLKMAFSNISLFKYLNRHKRAIGLGVFFYASLHLSLFLLDNMIPGINWENFQKPFVIIGLTAWGILFLLAITSNRFSVKKMGGKNWKWLHRTVYFMILLLFFHLVDRDKGNSQRAWLILGPIGGAEILRYLTYRRKQLKRI